MGHHAGLYVSLEETTVCVTDGMGRIVKEVRIPSEPEVLVTLFSGTGAGGGVDRA
jgi:transposase